MLQEMLRNEDTRRMMFSPEMMRMQLQMQRAMNRNGGGGGSSFPAPGATDNTPQPSATATGGGATATPNQPNTTGATEPSAAGGAQPNPFASLFPGANPFAQMQPNANSGTNSNATPQQGDAPAASPFGNIFGGGQGGQANPMADMARDLMQNPEAMRQVMQMMGGGAGGSPFGGLGQTGGPGATPGTNSPAPNPFAALLGGGGFGSGGFGTPPPADTRPPEQIYETQLAQLNEMGFYEFERNVSALRRSGGNVQGAIEYLLNGGS
jgi:ubiquilin